MRETRGPLNEFSGPGRQRIPGQASTEAQVDGTPLRQLADSHHRLSILITDKGCSCSSPRTAGLPTFLPVPWLRRCPRPAGGDQVNEALPGRRRRRIGHDEIAAIGVEIVAAHAGSWWSSGSSGDRGRRGSSVAWPVGSAFQVMVVFEVNRRFVMSPGVSAAFKRSNAPGSIVASPSPSLSRRRSRSSRSEARRAGKRRWGGSEVQAGRKPELPEVRPSAHVACRSFPVPEQSSEFHVRPADRAAR